ncbi:arylsulfatase [Sabulilitoribacter arenilitoris]|uniref:Arylsulfatase n=1 Tax=Wocania arenilitoris TaxID=2044858 RepID=A0AAE3EMN5_9FLAO|nr:arylsulfatase [Wocania arenilitoris]MCF7566854.1 arylsulfatase [Wocania arenilitoris]
MLKTKHLFFGFLILFHISCNKKEKVINKSPGKPNIVYILADDLGYSELGVYGQEKIETPNIDKLAKGGMLFTQHYSGAPVCAPARASLLTGKHLGHSYIRGNDEWHTRGKVWDYLEMAKDSTIEGQRPLPKNTITIAELLQQSGYATGIVGKWGLGAPNTHSLPTQMGFNYFFGYNCQRQAHTYTPLHLYENEKRYYLDNDTVPPNEKLDKNADPNDVASYKKYTQPFYAPEVSFDKMIGFVDSNKDKPFFLYWATPIPHMPLQAPKKWVDYYVNKFGEEPPYIGNKGYFPNRYPKATYAAMISYLDEKVGDLIAHLKSIDEYDNTLIIFTSDNGPSYAGGADPVWFKSAKPFNGEYGRGKGFLYEGGIRVPMIASWAGKIKPNTLTNHMSSFYDVMATLCDVAQIESPKNTDGISFYNTLVEKETQKKHDYMYWEFPEYNGQVAIRQGKWKFVWQKIKKGNTEVELYNLDEDLLEEHNIANNHPELIENFYQIIKKEHTTPEIDKFKIQALENIINSK